MTLQHHRFKRNLHDSQSWMPNHLPSDIWQHIGFKLPAVDRIRFRAVCKTWMSLIPSRQPPWLMLAEDKEEPSDEADPSLPKPPPPRRGFVSLGEQVVYKIDFPEVHNSRCVGSSGNWLITAHSDKTIRLLNPFSKTHILLPSQLELEDGVYHHHGEDLSQIELWKVVLSSSPSIGRGCIVMAIHHFKKILSIARLGDDKWTAVQIADPPAPYTVHVALNDHLIHYTIYVEVDDAVFYKGQFYAITTCGELLVCEIGDGEDPPKASYLTGPMEEYSVFRVNYLVEWSGELLAVLKFVDMIDEGLTYRTSKFEIYKFDFVNKKWNEVKSLGEHSLFLGYNTSVSVLASDYFGLVKKNCVYFTDDFVFGYIDISRNLQMDKPGGRDMGVFNLEDNSITPHFKGVSTSLYSPPVWIVPT